MEEGPRARDALSAEAARFLKRSIAIAEKWEEAAPFSLVQRRAVNGLPLWRCGLPPRPEYVVYGTGDANWCIRQQCDGEGGRGSRR